MTKQISLSIKTGPIADDERIMTYDADGNETGSRLLATEEARANKVPTGGSSGQVLTKASGTDFDTAWRDSTGSGSTTEVVASFSGYISFADYDAAAVFLDSTNGRAIDGDSTVVTGLTPAMDNDGGYSIAFAIRPHVTLTDITLDGVSLFPNFEKQANLLTINGLAYEIYAWDPWDANPRTGNGTWRLEGYTTQYQIPPSGTPGQYIGKDTGQDYDIDWKDLPPTPATWAVAGNTASIPINKVRDTLFGDVDTEVDTDQQQVVNIPANTVLSRRSSIGAPFNLTATQRADADAMIEIDWDVDAVGSSLPTSLSIQLWTSGLASNRIIGDPLNIKVTGEGLNRQGSHAFAIDTSVSSYIFEVYGATGTNASNMTITIENINIRYEDGVADPIIRAIAQGVTEDWAHTDNAAKIPADKLPFTGVPSGGTDGQVLTQTASGAPNWENSQLSPTGITFATAYPGQTISNTSANAYPVGATLFRPANDATGMLDLDDHSHGEFHASLRLVLTPASDVNMGFVEGKANQTADDREVLLSNFVYASDLAGEDAITATGSGIAPNGLEVFRVPVYSLSTIVGYYNLYFTHDNDNDAGYYWYWDGEAGSTGVTVTATLRTTFTPADNFQPAARNSRGRLLATSSVMSSTQQTADEQYSSVRWTLAANAGLTINTNKLYKPTFRTSPNQTGYWFVVEVDGTEVSETPIDFSSGQSNRLAILPAVNPMIRGGQAIELARIPDTHGVEYRLEGDPPGTLPTNTVVKIYMAII